jgi:hypothetical protein
LINSPKGEDAVNKIKELMKEYSKEGLDIEFQIL